MRLARGLVVSAVLALAGCSTSANEAATTPPAPAATSVAPTPTPTETYVVGIPSDIATPTGGLTDELRAVAGPQVYEVTENAPGEWEVQTQDIVDPRGEDGSQAALDAIAVCEAAVGLGATKVSVLESDGTTFVVYGHPAYGDVCTEV